MYVYSLVGFLTFLVLETLKEKAEPLCFGNFSNIYGVRRLRTFTIKLCFLVDETAKEATKEPDPSVSEEQQEEDEEGKKKVADETPSSSEEKVAPSGEGDTGELGVTAEKTEDSIVSAQGVCLM